MRLLVMLLVAAVVNVAVTAAVFSHLYRGAGGQAVDTRTADQLAKTAADALDRVAELKLSLLEALEEEDKAARPPASSSAAASTPPGTEQQPYLEIAIPTVARKRDYLGRALAVLRDQLPADPGSPLRGRVRVTVMSMMAAGEAHEHFEAAERRLGGAGSPFRFLRRTAPDKALPPVPNTTRFASKRPPPAVLKQSRDVVMLLRAVAGGSRHLFVMEDDFFVCPHGLRTLEYLLDKLHRAQPDWLAAKVSYGMSGFLMQNAARGGGADVRALADYLERRHHHRPPDHVYTEWASGETEESAAYRGARPHVAFRYNLLHHVGAESSLRSAPSGSFATCFDELVAPVLFEVDAFNTARCGHDDISPCAPAGGGAGDARFIGPPFRPPASW